MCHARGIVWHRRSLALACAVSNMDFCTDGRRASIKTSGLGVLFAVWWCSTAQQGSEAMLLGRSGRSNSDVPFIVSSTHNLVVSTRSADVTCMSDVSSATGVPHSMCLDTIIHAGKIIQMRSNGRTSILSLRSVCLHVVFSAFTLCCGSLRPGALGRSPEHAALTFHAQVDSCATV